MSRTILSVFAALTTASACGGADPAASEAAIAEGTTPLAAATGLVIYPRGVAIPDCELTDLGPPEGLGGAVLSGDPRISARVDHVDGPLTAGVFQATRGTVMIHFPFTEHATIIAGTVTLTDPTGQRAELRPGDSYVIGQGTDILWEVSGARVQKSFLNRVEPVDVPGPMRIHRRGHAVPDAELVALGAPEAIGGVTLAGTPQVSARFDGARVATEAGIMRVTRGLVSVPFPFTGHAAVTDGRLDLTGPDGREYVLREGDAYLVTVGTEVLWDISRAATEQSFFHAAP